MTIDAHAELIVVRGDDYLGFLAVFAAGGLQADEPAVLPPFLGLDFEGVVDDEEMAEGHIDGTLHIGRAVVGLHQLHVRHAGVLAVHDDGVFTNLLIIRPNRGNRGKQG